MSFDSLLAQTARVWRRAGGSNARDRFGQPVDAWSQVGDFPCRIGAAMSGGEQDTERMREVYHLQNTVYLQPDADVHEDDQIQVLDPNDEEIFPRADVRHRQVVVGYDGTAHHLECAIEVSRGPQ